MSELVRTFGCFGGRVSVRVAAGGARAAAALRRAELDLRLAHGRLTRFEPSSELSRLNADPRRAVPASALLLELASLVRWAGEVSGGLVDATQVRALERAGYVRSRGRLAGLDGAAFAAAAGELTARAAIPDLAARWRSVAVDRERGLVLRPRGVLLDGGGLAKGLVADLLGRRLGEHAAFAVDAAGDLLLGGTAPRPRTIVVRDPFGGRPVRELRVAAGAVATSGVTQRSWLRPDGSLGHHLVDPGRREPAWTGLLQVTALAPTAVEAEVRAKAALLAGPAGAARFLPGGGVLVHADGRAEEIPASGTAATPSPSPLAPPSAPLAA
ncbi:MAG TPA: FAD:protein FMN transferase [Thermoleophilaceae bacterium]